MSSVLATLLSYLLLYRYTTLFCIMLIAAIGIPLPTDTLLIAIGAFSFQGYFNLWISLTVAVIANVIGDTSDYLLAKKYGHVLVREKYAKKYSFFIRLEKFFNLYTGLTIFVTRFIGILSPLTNFLAGFEKIPTRKFMWYSFLGNTTDTLMLLTAGYFIGDNWESVSGSVTWIGSLMSIIFILFALYHIFGFTKKSDAGEVKE